MPVLDRERALPKSDKTHNHANLRLYDKVFAKKSFGVCLMLGCVIINFILDKKHTLSNSIKSLRQK